MNRHASRDLREAVQRGDVEHVQEAVVHVLDMFDKAAALTLAVKLNDRSCARALLDAGCDPCLRYEGRSALYWAVVTDNEDILDLLLSDIMWQFDLDQLTLTPSEVTLIHGATHDGVSDTGCFGFCSGSGSVKRSESEKQRAKVQRAINGALFEAASHASALCVRRLLETGAAVNQCHYHDDERLSWCSPLIAACASPITAGARPTAALQAVESLVRLGADIATGNCYGQSALHWASRAALLDALPLLLRNGADIDLRDKQGQTPLMSACDRGGVGCLAVCRCLVSWAADVSCRGEKDDYSAFHFAVGNNDREVVSFFLREVGVCPTTGACFQPTSGRHCAHVAISYTDSSTWQQLTPLDIAVNNNQLDMVKLLLRAYADVNAPSHYNRTTVGGIIYLATESTEIMELLIEAGLDPHEMWVAARNRHLKPVIKGILQRYINAPPVPLMHQARLCIRRQVARHYREVHSLPLPPALKDYVDMRDMLV